MPELKVSPDETSSCNDSWNDLLKCPVCLFYFWEPVNLFCGHTFCKRCLTKMAINTKMQRPDIPISRLQMWCPTCRHPLPVRLYIGPHVNVCYVLRDIVLLLMAEKQRLFRPATVPSRTTSSQTDLSCLCVVPLNTFSTETKYRDHNNNTNVENNTTLMKPDSMMPLITAMGYYNRTCSDKNENRRDLAPDMSESDVYDTDDDSTEEEIQFTDNLQDLETLNRQELTRRRMWMLLFWVVYTCIMAIISHGFLPYIIVYSLVLLLIIYVDSMQYQAMESIH